MILYTCGCSFTYGTELRYPKRDAWPYVLGRKLECDVINDGLTGASNTYIFRKTLNFLLQNKHLHKDLFVIIGWTTFHRTEYNLGDDIYNTSILPSKICKNTKNGFNVHRYLINNYLSLCLQNNKNRYYDVLQSLFNIFQIPFFNFFINKKSITSIEQNQTTPTFLDWCEQYNYKIGICHPLEEAHAAWGNYLYKKLFLKKRCN